MKTATALYVASTIGLAHAWAHLGNLVGRAGPIEQSDHRPRLSAMIKHMEHHGTITWEDPADGSGNMVAVYNKTDWDDARAHLNSVNDHQQPASATLAPRMPQSDVTTHGTIAPEQTDTATGTVAPSSGTSSALMADSTNHVTKWVCKAPYNIPFNLAEGAPLAVICNYLFSWLTNRATGPADTVVQRTMMAEGYRAESPGRPARIAIHAEKNTLWPALSAVMCAGVIAQIVNQGYCWGYGEKFATDSGSRKRQVIDGTVGGTVWIYDTTGLIPVGLIEIEALDDE